MILQNSPRLQLLTDESYHLTEMIVYEIADDGVRSRSPDLGSPRSELPAALAAPPARAALSPRLGM